MIKVADASTNTGGYAAEFDLPIIATDVGGLKETIEHMKTGLIVDQPEVIAISESVNQYFKNDLGKQFAPNIEIYKDKHSWQNFSEELTNFALNFSIYAFISQVVTCGKIT